MAKATPRDGTLTAHYGWVKPVPGASDDVWGGYINADLDGIDTTVFAVQGSIPGASTTTPVMDGTAAIGASALFARADHVHPTDTTRYAASNPAGYQTAANVTASLAPYALATAVPAPATANPAMNGAAAPGTATTFARGDHVHPTDTSLYPASNPNGYQNAAQITAALGGYLPLAGGVLTGALTPSQTAGIVGTNTNNNANAGAVGEFISAAKVTATACLNNATINIISISLGAGDWDVEGCANAVFTGTPQFIAFAITTVSATLPATTVPGVAGFETSAPHPSLATGTLRVLAAAATTVYLIGTASFSSGACSMQGTIQARRRR